MSVGTKYRNFKKTVEMKCRNAKRKLGYFIDRNEEKIIKGTIVVSTFVVPAACKIATTVSKTKREKDIDGKAYRVWDPSHRCYHYASRKLTNHDREYIARRHFEFGESYADIFRSMNIVRYRPL